MNKCKIRLFRKLLKYTLGKNLRYYIDFIFFSFGFFISTFISLLITVLINKNLTQIELGEFSYNKSILEFSAYILTLTIYRSYLRFNTNGTSLVLKQIVNVITKISLSLLIIISYFLTNSLIASLFAFFILFEERLYFTRSVMYTSGVNKLRIGSYLLTLLSIFCFVLFDNITAEKVLFSYGLGFLFAIFFYKKKFPINNDKGIVYAKDILFFCLPGLGSILVKWSLDVSAQLLLKEYFDFIEVSKFAVALRILMSIKLFSSLFMMFYPMVYYREIQKGNVNLITKMRFGMISFMFFISLLAFCFANQLYTLMGASSYLEYIGLFRILIIAEFIFIIGNFWGTYLSFALKTHISLFIVFIGALTNIIMLILTLKNYGIYMAAYSILVSNTLISLLLLNFSYRQEIKFLSINLRKD